jgi:lipoyl-dependent peroxiredoxin
MADILRSAEAVWDGDLRGGKGRFSAASGLFKETPYSFATRFESAPGTNPEELIAAALAACYSMALSATLGAKGHKPERIQTKAICHLTPQQPAGFAITKMSLETRGKVPGLDEATFRQIALEMKCPVSGALQGNVAIEIDAKLL